MKENIKVDSDLLGKVRKKVKKTGQTISGFFEIAAVEALYPSYEAPLNSDKFREYLDAKGIKWKSNGSFTTVFDVNNPIGLGMDWAIYERENNPKYRQPPFPTEVIDKY